MRHPGAGSGPRFERLTEELVECRRCPRLVAWREQVAREKRTAFRDQTYWGRPVPGFGDPAARLLILGLAPAAHGGNRTGRIFTGDRSGDWLFASLYRTGFASQPTSVARDDGLALTDCYITAPVKCAPPDNKPLPEERTTCAPWLSQELALLDSTLHVVVALGSYAWDTPRPGPSRQLPRQPAEHLDEKADRTDARRGLSQGTGVAPRRWAGAVASLLRTPRCEPDAQGRRPCGRRRSPAGPPTPRQGR